MRTLVLLGAGGHARSVADLAARMGRTVAGCIAPAGDPVGALRWLGDDAWLDDLQAREHAFIVAAGQVGISPLRQRLFDLLLHHGLAIDGLESPFATVSPDARIGPGCAILHRVVVGPAAKIGANCIVNTGAIVEHDARVGDHCHVSTGAIVNGGAELGSGSMLGSGAVLLHGVSVVGSTVIGAGSVVTQDIVRPGTYVGIPARKIK